MELFCKYIRIQPSHARRFICCALECAIILLACLLFEGETFKHSSESSDEFVS